MGLFIFLFAVIIGAIIAKYIIAKNKEKNNNTPPNDTYDHKLPLDANNYNIQQPVSSINVPNASTNEKEIYPYHKKYLLTKNEYYFFQKLYNITQPLDLQILAKIRLADLLDVNNNLSKSDWAKYFAKIKSKHIDFAIADKMNIIALIELDDRSHENNERKERDNFVNNALRTAGYTVLHSFGDTHGIKTMLQSKGYQINTDR